MAHDDPRLVRAVARGCPVKRRLDPATLVPGESQCERTARLNRERASRHAALKRAARGPSKVQAKSGAVVVVGPSVVDAAHVRAAALQSLPW